MIRRSVSAIYLLRDGFTGRPMSAAAVQCELDGRTIFPLWKPGGYLVLTDLAPGGHRLVFRGRGYQDETVEFTVQPGALEEVVALKPGPDYPFREDVTRLELTLTGRFTAGAEIWIAAPVRTELKLAQERAKAGEETIRVFCRGSAALLPIPGHFLLSDGKLPEIVRLRALEGETVLLAAPLRQSHGRGKLLLPAQSFRIGPEGILRAAFHSPGRVEVLAEGRAETLELVEGENRLSLSLS